MAIFEPVLEALDAAGVRYVAVGGVAVVLHGHPRLTTALDLAVDLAPRPAAAAIDALAKLGFQSRLPLDPAGFSDVSVRNKWIEGKGMTVLSMGDPVDPTRSVDLFLAEPIAFEELWERSELVALEGIHVRIASIPDLIRMKQISGRPLDAEDIQALTTILEQRGSGAVTPVDAQAMSGWEQHRRDQLRRTASATPLQRLRWLEEAIAFAQRAGALPRPSAPKPTR